MPVRTGAGTRTASGARAAAARNSLQGLIFDGYQSLVDIGKLGNFGANWGSGLYLSFQIATTNNSTRMAVCGSNHSGGPEIDVFLNWNGSKVVNSTLDFNMRDASANRIQAYFTDTGLFDGNLHTVTITVNVSAKTVVFTVDGVTQTTTYVTQNTLTNYANLSIDFVIGSWSNSGTVNANALAGIMTSFQIGTTSSTLYGSYSFTAQAGVSIADTSGNGNTGTFGGYGGLAGGPPTWTTMIGGGRLPASPATPLPVILDSDCASDIDDYGAITCALRHQLAGDCTVLGINVNTSSTYSPGAIDAMRKYLGLAAIPISSHAAVGTFLPVPANACYQYAYNTFAHDTGLASSCSTPTTNFRTLLAARSKSDVVMIAIGYGNDLATLLQSPGDGISPLTGLQLVAASCKLLVWTGGVYPTGTDPANFARDLTDAAYVITNWPTPVIFFPGGAPGSSIGGDILSPNTLSSLSALSPCKAVYQQYGAFDSGHASWDMCTTMIGIEGLGAWQLIGPGTNALNTSTGVNTFTPGAGSHYYVETAQSYIYYQNHFTDLLRC